MGVGFLWLTANSVTGFNLSDACTAATWKIYRYLLSNTSAWMVQILLWWLSSVCLRPPILIPIYLLDDRDRMKSKLMLVGPEPPSTNSRCCGHATCCWRSNNQVHSVADSHWLPCGATMRTKWLSFIELVVVDRFAKQIIPSAWGHCQNDNNAPVNQCAYWLVAWLLLSPLVCLTMVDASCSPEHD